MPNNLQTLEKEIRSKLPHTMELIDSLINLIPKR
jgi:hypothetical protein